MVARMSAKTRKLIGTVGLLLFLAAYVALAGAVGLGRIAESPPLIRLGYALIAGLAWVIPAGLLIGWMQRPKPCSDVKPRSPAGSGSPARKARPRGRVPYR
jgi:hypothetical protein